MKNKELNQKKCHIAGIIGLIFELACFALMVYVLNAWIDIEFRRQTITVVYMHTTCMALDAVILFSFLRANTYNRGRIGFMMLNIGICFVLMVDALSWFFNGMAAYRNLVILLNTLDFVMDNILVLSTWIFVRYTFEKKYDFQRWMSTLVSVFTVVGVLSAIGNLFTPYIFTVDANANYISGPLYFVACAWPLLTSCAIIYAAVKIRVEIHEKLTLMSYILLPLIPLLIAWNQGEQSLTYYLFFFGVSVFMYCNIVVAEEKDAVIRKAQLEIQQSDLNVASRIQVGMLPNDFNVFAEHHIDLYANMNPARDVGGDFYDCYMLDPEHLVVFMADVSGKGLPASIFMAIGKTLLHRSIIEHETLGEAVSATHSAICEENTQDMFITMWAGIIDLKNNTLTYTNAGHNQPLIRREGGDFEYLTGRHGLVLGCSLKPDMKYRQSTIDFAPGDVLYLYTDGVTEAHSIEKELYGEDRLARLINQTKDMDAASAIRLVTEDINEFVGTAPQFDDITMMYIRRT